MSFRRVEPDDLPPPFGSNRSAGRGGPVAEAAGPSRVRAQRGGRKKSLHDVWIDTMVPVCFKINCTVSIPPAQFNANVKYLREVRGVDRDKLEGLIALFSEKVTSSVVKLDGKNAWRVFMGYWPKLTAAQAVEVRSEADLDESAWLL